MGLVPFVILSLPLTLSFHISNTHHIYTGGLCALRLPVDPAGISLGGDGDGDENNNNMILSTHSSGTNLGGLDDDDHSIHEHNHIEMPSLERIQSGGVFRIPRHHRSHPQTMIDIQQENRL